MPAGANPWTDRSYLRHEQYVDDRNLSARRSIYAFQHPPLDLVGTVLDNLDLGGEERLVDVGCGPGHYLRTLVAAGHSGKLLGVDLSAGMLEVLRTALPTTAVVSADAVALPLRAASADVVIAAHMLYHLPDVHRGVGEMRRVLRPGGRLVVVLNGEDHLRELRAAMETVNARLGLPTMEWGSHRLHLDIGESLLREHFSSVSRTDFGGHLVVDEREPLASYVASTISRPRHEGQDRYVSEVVDRLLREGEVRIRTHAGCLVAVR